MLTAEASNPVGRAFGFPDRGDGSRWPGSGGALPVAVGRLTATGRSFTCTWIPPVFLPLVLPLGVRTAARADWLEHRAWSRWSP